MVPLTDDILRDPRRVGLTGGFRAGEVVVVDPAVRTGTFLLGILRHVAEKIEADLGAGDISEMMDAIAQRLMALSCSLDFSLCLSFGF